MNTKVASLIFIVLLSMSCASKKNVNSVESDQPIAPQKITDITWELSILEGEDIAPSETSDEQIYFVLNSADKSVTGFSGCNVFRGIYKLEDGNRIRMSKIASTRRACFDAKVSESELFKVLEMADNFTFDGGVLRLNVGRRAPLAVFKERKPAENVITEKHWKLTTLQGKKVDMAANQEKERFFMLTAQDNRVSGFAGCNHFNGTFTLEEGNRIRFSSQIATTMRICPDVDINESEFLQVFAMADNYTLNGDTLMLNVGRRAPLAVFEAVYK